MSFTRITVGPGQMDGLPCIRGLRIPVVTVVDMVADVEIVAAYPDLEVEDVQEAIRYATETVRDHNFALAGNFEYVDPHSRPISEIPEEELMRGFGA